MMCCKVPRIKELNKPPGRWCQHAVIGKGCGTYQNRPSACQRFYCQWMLDPALGEAWKPERAKFVLYPDPTREEVFIVAADRSFPEAWRQPPYFAAMQSWIRQGAERGRILLVHIGTRWLAMLPDQIIELGNFAEDFVVERERDASGKAIKLRVLPSSPSQSPRQGSGYNARLQSPDDLAGTAKAGIDALAGRRLESSQDQGEAAGTGAVSASDPAFLEASFREAFEKTRRLLDDPQVDDLKAHAWTLQGRNKVLDETAATYARLASAQCQSGCVSCCYLMVLGTPFEILSIARQLLESKTGAELEALKERLRTVAEIPLDPALRAKARTPCALLVDGLCSAYELRPSVCRMMLSQSRQACEACLKGASGSIPYIDQPSKIAAAIQMGIDYALISRRNLSTERAELSRALLIALHDYQGALAKWLDGGDPFAAARAGMASPNAEMTIGAARRLGLA
jgi:Fe-S-cluster containining protein